MTRRRARKGRIHQTHPKFWYTAELALDEMRYDRLSRSMVHKVSRGEQLTLDPNFFENRAFEKIVQDASALLSTRRATATRATRILQCWSLALPHRVATEDLGGYIETVGQLRDKGAPRWEVYLRAVSAIFWTGCSALREIPVFRRDKRKERSWNLAHERPACVIFLRRSEFSIGVRLSILGVVKFASTYKGVIDEEPSPCSTYRRAFCFQRSREHHRSRFQRRVRRRGPARRGGAGRGNERDRYLGILRGPKR